MTHSSPPSPVSQRSCRETLSGLENSSLDLQCNAHIQAPRILFRPGDCLARDAVHVVGEGSVVEVLRSASCEMGEKVPDVACAEHLCEDQQRNPTPTLATFSVCAPFFISCCISNVPVFRFAPCASTKYDRCIRGAAQCFTP